MHVSQTQFSPCRRGEFFIRPGADNPMLSMAFARSAIGATMHCWQTQVGG
jgi:hypothetical protein